ncbi:MAG: HPr(Ser) kinase/phosphatase [Lachnospiraceae bacterium]|nr:HPr(Ser) kinase/phosphatase [Lachnospiraceae bacterium]
MYAVEMMRMAERFSLSNLTPGLTLKDRWIWHSDLNRPALQLTGYYEYFDAERVQLIGNVEYSYLISLSPQDRRNVFERLFATDIPCLIVCRGLGKMFEKSILELAESHDIPILSTEQATTSFSADLTQFLRMELAPRISLHGVMVDCFGEGVLIMGESGIGKSETALELVQRGHRLVADDVVEIRKISDAELMAQGSEVIQNLIELRGIGVLNVKELYGVQSIRMNKSIDMVIKLEPWDRERQYDRMGLEVETIDILGTDVVCYSIPIRPGRNLAIIIESAALNHRQKKMGYSAAEELRERVNGNIRRRRQERELQKQQSLKEQKESPEK